jgi:hypothetical protein
VFGGLLIALLAAPTFARMPGFKEFVAQNIRLAAQDLRRVDIRLEVGSIRLVEAA